MITFHRQMSVAGVGIALAIALLIGTTVWSIGQSKRGVERAIKENFTAAGLLAQIQVQAEKMRRYEKEMFIYVAVPDKRTNYVKEFDGAYTKLLSSLDEAMMVSRNTFDEAERKDILQWKEAAVFYAGAFTRLASRADSSSAQLAEQRATATIEYNDAIKEGKDRFRVLLNGTEKLRLEKEASSQAIATELSTIFKNLSMGVQLGGLLLIIAVLYALRQRTPARPVVGLQRSRQT